MMQQCVYVQLCMLGVGKPRKIRGMGLVDFPFAVG